MVRGLGFAALSLLEGCFTPPVLGGERHEDPDRVIAQRLALEEGSPLVPVALAGDEAPPDGFFFDVPGAPVIVHFLASGVNLSDRDLGFPRFAKELAALGFASLAFDYPGIGLSRTPKQPNELAAFGRNVIARARDLAPGRPLIVRGTSLGSMVAASALATGEDIAAAVWVAPVRPDTINLRFARCAVLWLPGTLLAPFFRDPPLSSAWDYAGDQPSFVIASEGDPLLAKHHLTELLELAKRGGGGFRLLTPKTHLIPSHYSGCLAEGEATFLAQHGGLEEGQLRSSVFERMRQDFQVDDAALEEFDRVLGSSALETGVSLLLLHAHRTSPDPLNLLPRHPSGTPLSPDLWLPYLREIREYEALKRGGFPGWRFPEVIGHLLFQRRTQKGTPGGASSPFSKLTYSLRGWPFSEELELHFDESFLRSRNFLPLQVYWSDSPHRWILDEPDGPWLAVTRSDQSVLWLHPDPDVESRQVEPADADSFGQPGGADSFSQPGGADSFSQLRARTP